MGGRKILIVSSDYSFASILERELGSDYEVHSAATDIAAFALLDMYQYGCLVIDLSSRSIAGSATVAGLRLSALTLPVVALVPPRSEITLPERSLVCVADGDPIPRVAALVREAAR